MGYTKKVDIQTISRVPKYRTDSVCLFSHTIFVVVVFVNCGSRMLEKSRKEIKKCGYLMSPPSFMCVVCCVCSIQILLSIAFVSNFDCFEYSVPEATAAVAACHGQAAISPFLFIHFSFVHKSCVYIFFIFFDIACSTQFVHIKLR